MKAFDGVLAMGRKKSAWASRGEGVGAWIHAEFNKMKAVSQIKLLQRVFPGYYYYYDLLNHMNI